VVCEVIEDHPSFTLGERLGRESSPDAAAGAEILVDVSHPDASPAIVEAALGRGQRVIIGTSGWGSDRIAWLESLVAKTPGASALVIPNFSLGSVLGTALAQMVAPYFGSAEIVEAHHDQKVDSPSGTAVRTAELMAAARSEGSFQAPHADQEARGQLIAGIPVHSLRLRGVIARQEVRFGGDGEVLTITHDTHSQDSYRAGIRLALEAIPTVSGVMVGLDAVMGIRLA